MLTNSSSTGSSGSESFGSTGSGSSKFSMGGWAFGAIVMLWNSFWADFKQAVWDSTMNWCMNTIYCSVVVLVLGVVYCILFTDVPRNVGTWFAKTFAKSCRSRKELDLNAGAKDKNAEVDHSTRATIRAICIYVLAVLSFIAFVDIFVRRSESCLWIIMSATWDHFAENSACNVFALDTSACLRVVPDFLLRTLMPEGLYRLITESDRKSFWLMLVGLVGCAVTVSWLVYLTIRDMKKIGLDNYRNWRFWVRQTANPHRKKDAKTLKKEADEARRLYLNEVRAEKYQEYQELWKEGDYFSYGFFQARDLVSWILKSLWKLSSLSVNWTLIIVVFLFVLFYFFPNAACAMTPWCGWKTMNVSNSTNGSFENKSHHSFPAGPQPAANETDGTGQANTAEGQTDQQSKTKAGQSEPVDTDYVLEAIKKLTGNEEAQVSQGEQALRNTVHFLYTTQTSLWSTLLSTMHNIQEAAFSLQEPSAGASKTGEAQDHAKDQSKPAQETPQEGKTETEKPKADTSEEVKIEEGRPNEFLAPDFFKATPGTYKSSSDTAPHTTPSDIAPQRG